VKWIRFGFGLEHFFFFFLKAGRIRAIPVFGFPSMGSDLSVFLFLIFLKKYFLNFCFFLLVKN